jgi:hypothetical protein
MGSLRTFIQEQVTALGGTYSPDLTRKCTRLIAEAATGEKYRYAIAWNVPVVKSDWFFECLNSRSAVSPTPYILVPASPYRPRIPRSTPFFAPSPRSAVKRQFIEITSDTVRVQSPPLPRSSSRDGPDAILRSSFEEFRVFSSPPPSEARQSLEQILSLCNAICESSLTPTTVCHLLSGANEDRSPLLRAACMQYIADHWEEEAEGLVHGHLSPMIGNVLHASCPQ